MELNENDKKEINDKITNAVNSLAGDADNNYGDAKDLATLITLLISRLKNPEALAAAKKAKDANQDVLDMIAGNPDYTFGALSIIAGLIHNGAFPAIITGKAYLGITELIGRIAEQNDLV